MNDGRIIHCHFNLTGADPRPEIDSREHQEQRVHLGQNSESPQRRRRRQQPGLPRHRAAHVLRLLSAGEPASEKSLIDFKMRHTSRNQNVLCWSYIWRHLNQFYSYNTYNDMWLWSIADIEKSAPARQPLFTHTRTIYQILNTSICQHQNCPTMVLLLYSVIRVLSFLTVYSAWWFQRSTVHSTLF